MVKKKPGNNIAAVVEEMAAPLAGGLGLELVDVEFIKEGGQWILRVYIDKPGGISHDDCKALSERLDTLLDEKDPIPQSYFLEVSSPGIERPIKKPQDFQRFRGQAVSVTTYSPLDGKKRFTGILGGVEEGVLTLEVEGKKTAIPMEQVASARLTVDF